MQTRKLLVICRIFIINVVLKAFPQAVKFDYATHAENLVSL
jgi:hypothetical protein